MPTIQQVVRDNTEALALRWLAGEGGVMRKVDSLSHAAADLVGHLNLVHPSRLQVLGLAEQAFFMHARANKRISYMHELLEGGVPGMILADNLKPEEEVRQFFAQHDIPLLASPLPSAEVIEVLRHYFTKLFAEKTSLHGVFMDVLGLGVLITGDPGLGKSELGLELISRGHGLVADDSVEISKIAPQQLEGRCPPLLQNYLEVRGLGLLDIKAIFGETAVRRRMRLRLIVHLTRRQEVTEEERFPLTPVYESVLGVNVRRVLLPVAAGRNLAVLLEAAVRNTILQLRGIDAMKEFSERQQKAMFEEEK